MSDNLTGLLKGAVPPGVYRLASRAGAANVGRRAEGLGWRFFHLDGRQVASKSTFLLACAHAMRFPSHFGHNWDALADSLRDLSWAPTTRGYVLLYDDAGRLAEASPADMAIALDILRSAVQSWQGTATPLVALLRGLGRGARLPSL